jgi:iron complex outermembrane recepter protein
VLNTGLRKALRGNRGIFQLSVDDVLKSGTMSSYFGALTEEAFDLKSHVLYHGEASKFRFFRLSYSRSFGSSPGRKGARPADVEEERERIGK